MRIKLRGIEEFDAFTVIVRLLISGINSSGVETLSDWCNLKSVEKLMLKLIQTAARQGQFKRKISVELDELQTVLLYEMLQQCPLAAYEQNLANRLIGQLEQEYSKARALQMSLIDRTGARIRKLVGAGHALPRPNANGI
jgi:hypothetical protein